MWHSGYLANARTQPSAAPHAAAAAAAATGQRSHLHRHTHTQQPNCYTMHHTNTKPTAARPCTTVTLATHANDTSQPHVLSSRVPASNHSRRSFAPPWHPMFSVPISAPGPPNLGQLLCIGSICWPPSNLQHRIREKAAGQGRRARFWGLRMVGRKKNRGEGAGLPIFWRIWRQFLRSAGRSGYFGARIRNLQHRISGEGRRQHRGTHLQHRRHMFP